jgi:serine/threonine-protein kinase
MYALGLMLHELFTGSPAYPAQLDWLDLTRRVRRGETLPATTFDAHLTSLIERLKDPDASRRPASKETLSRLRWIQEKPRRTRRRALGAAAVAAMIVFAVKYAVDLRYERSAAVAAREEADRRRDQAEDLISFMLGDLRARLEPVGRLDVLDEVGARATRYFAAVPEAALTAEELYRRSQALRQIGEVRISQGNMPAATEAFAQSLRLAEDLARRDPANGQWQVGLAASYFFVGVVPFYGRDYLAARGPWEKYLEVASRLVERDPNKSEYLMELAYAHSNLHSIDDALGNYDAALVSGRKSVEIKERLLRQDPSNHVTALELARVRSKVGLTLEAKGDIQAAIREFRHFVEAMSALAARDPSDMRLRFELTSSHIFLGNTLLTFGDVRGARAEFEKAMQLSASLRARDPDNVEWQRDEIFVRRGIADVLLAEGDHRAAIRELDIANALPDALLARDKSNNHWKRHVGYSRLKRARALLTAGDVQRAKRDVTDAIGMLQSLLDQLPTDRGGRRQLAEAHVTHAHLLMATGDGDGARRAFQRAADLVATLVATSFAADIGEPYARALIGLKDVTRAQQVFDDLARVGHWNRDLLLIGRAAGLNVALERTANLR